MKIISLFGAKHGVGTSTTAALLQTTIPDSLLATHDLEDALCLTGGMSVHHDDEPQLTLDNTTFDPNAITQDVVRFDPRTAPSEAHLRTARFKVGGDTIIMDWGTHFPAVGLVVCVTDNSYLALRRLMKHDHTRIWRTICIREPNRALTVRDVEHVVAGPVVWIDRDSSVQRSCDAGLLLTRLPLHTRTPLEHLNQEAIAACSSSSTH